MSKFVLYSFSVSQIKKLGMYKISNQSLTYTYTKKLIEIDFQFKINKIYYYLAKSECNLSIDQFHDQGGKKLHEFEL